MKALKYIFILSIAFVFIGCEIQDPLEDNIGRGEHIGEFTLADPSNFAEVTLNPGTPDDVVRLSWNAPLTGLGGAVTYKVIFDEKGGDFSSGILQLPSANEGLSNHIDIKIGDIISAVGSGGEFIWTVEAMTETDLGVNRVKAKLPYHLDIKVTATGISSYSYLSPEPNQKMVLDKVRKGDESIVFSWEEATSTEDITYKILFATTKDGFDEPVLEFVSDMEGSSTHLTFTHSEFVEILKNISYNDGLYWKVEATAGDLKFSPEIRFVWFDIFDIPTLYALGDATSAGWNNNETDPIAFNKDGEGLFSVITYLTGSKDLKFVMTAGSWDVNWGGPGGMASLDTDHQLESNGSNIVVPEDGLYKINVDFADGIFRLTKLHIPDNLYLVGGSTSAGWDPSSSVPFTNVGTGKFELYEYLTVAGDGFKFLEVKDWAGDWGLKPGTENGLAQEGENNVTVVEDAFYKISVDFTNLTYSLTKIQWGIIGDATPGGWSEDTDMSFSNTKGDYTWSINVTLNNGEMKFRANDDWSINLGDNGNDGFLEYNGANIGVSAGTYTISLTLSPDGGYTYTIQ